MTRRLRRSAWVVVLAAAGVAGAALVRHGRPTTSPVLVVRTAPSSSTGPEAEPGEEERAMALAVASISPAERRRVLDSMNYATARLEARLSPLGSDFGDDEGDPQQQLQRAMAVYMPAFTAARELVHGRWQSVDIAVRIASSCKDAHVAQDETCFALWNETEGPPQLARRARFLAWAASRAAVIDLGTPERARAAAAALRERTAVESSPIALVLTNDDLALHLVPERPALPEAARRLGRAMAANLLEDKGHLEAFARSVPEGRVAPWLDLPENGIVIVPRLSALARTEDLRREIEAAGGSDVRWVHRP